MISSHIRIAATLFTASSLVAAAPVNNTLAARQGACGVWSSYTALVGDGDPHQNYLHKQLSQSLSCGDGTCTVGRESSVSYTIGFSVSATVDEWIDGGFDVSASWETGNEYDCDGAAGETVCVMQKIAHTAYTVQNYDENQCTGATPQGQSVIKSPNSNNDGGGFYCERSSCGSQGDEYWEDFDTAPAGGPP